MVYGKILLICSKSFLNVKDNTENIQITIYLLLTNNAEVDFTKGLKHTKAIFIDVKPINVLKKYSESILL